MNYTINLDMTYTMNLDQYSITIETNKHVKEGDSNMTN